MRLNRSKRRRSGATTVEFALVSILLFTMLFGILEYARFLFIHHMTTNAARDGARFAVVHTGGGTMPNESATISTADVISVVTTGNFAGNTDPTIRYGAGMCGLEGNLVGYNVAVYAIPDASLYLSTPDIDPAGKPAWNSSAFQQKIAVQLTGTYYPVVPGLIGLSSSIPFKVTVILGSEAN